MNEKIANEVQRNVTSSRGDLHILNSGLYSEKSGKEGGGSNSFDFQAGPKYEEKSRNARLSRREGRGGSFSMITEPRLPRHRFGILILNFAR